VTYTKKQALKFIEELRSRADFLFDQYKIWAFQTAYNIRMKHRETVAVSPADCFMWAIAWTCDSALDYKDMNEKELIGFYRWYREVKMKVKEEQE